MDCNIVVVEIMTRMSKWHLREEDGQKVRPSGPGGVVGGPNSPAAD